MMFRTMARIIKRYSNRKLYDTQDSHYVTLGKVAELIRAGEDLQVSRERHRQRHHRHHHGSDHLRGREAPSQGYLLKGLRRIIRSGLPM
jgi:hypothetical protein